MREIKAFKDFIGSWHQSNNLDNGVTFQDFGDDYTDLLDEICLTRPAVVIEIGSYSGRSSAAIGQCLRSWQGTLICVDTWLGNPKTWFDPDLRPSLRMKNGRPNVYETFCSNMINLNLTDTVVPLCQTSSNAAEILRKFDLDIGFIFWDSGHDQVRQDLELYLPLLASNGIFIGDDLNQHPEISDQLNQFVTANPDYAWQPFGRNNWKIYRN